MVELEANSLRERDKPTPVGLEPDGTPTWWPRRHPNLEHGLNAAPRRRWASEWSPSKRILLSADRGSRRQLIARSLIQLLHG
jgi:hypothetical protein